MACLQEQTSAFAFENDQMVPVGILVGVMRTKQNTDSEWLLAHWKRSVKSVRMGGLKIFKHDD